MTVDNSLPSLLGSNVSRITSLGTCATGLFLTGLNGSPSKVSLTSNFGVQRTLFPPSFRGLVMHLLLDFSLRGDLESFRIDRRLCIDNGVLPGDWEDGISVFTTVFGVRGGGIMISEDRRD